MGHEQGQGTWTGHGWGEKVTGHGQDKDVQAMGGTGQRGGTQDWTGQGWGSGGTAWLGHGMGRDGTGTRDMMAEEWDKDGMGQGRDTYGMGHVSDRDETWWTMDGTGWDRYGKRHEHEWTGMGWDRDKDTGH